MKTYILYHSNCPDGTGAALAAWLKLGSDAEYIPVSYGQPTPEIEAGSIVYILDFSYPRDVLIHLNENVTNKLVVLDHHATAEKDLAGLPFCTFDMNKSGAVLAWEYFHSGKPVPMFILYLQDRDLWKFELPLSREVSAAIGSYEFTVASFDAISGIGRPDEPLYIARLQDEGRGCLRLKNQQVQNMVKHHRWAYLHLPLKKITFSKELEPGGNGEPTAPITTEIMPVSNASVFFSEVGEALLEKYPSMQCAAYYSDRADGKRQWGLRSRKGFDCSAVAKVFGGGGHPQAAGFVQEVP